MRISRIRRLAMRTQLIPLFQKKYDNSPLVSSNHFCIIRNQFMTSATHIYTHKGFLLPFFMNVKKNTNAFSTFYMPIKRKAKDKKKKKTFSTF